MIRKNKILRCLCVACIRECECLTRERSPCSRAHFPQLSSPARSSWWLGQRSPAQLATAGAELALRSRADCGSGRPNMHELGRAAPAFPVPRLPCSSSFPPSPLPSRLDAVYHRAELDRRWDFRAIRQQSVHTATRFHARVIRMYNAASAITHSPGSTRRFCDLVRRRVPPLS